MVLSAAKGNTRGNLQGNSTHFNQLKEFCSHPTGIFTHTIKSKTIVTKHTKKYKIVYKNSDSCKFSLKPDLFFVLVVVVVFTKSTVLGNSSFSNLHDMLHFYSESFT